MVPCKHKPIQPSLPVLSERAQRFYPYIQVCKHCGKQIVPKHPRWIRPIRACLGFGKRYSRGFAAILSVPFIRAAGPRRNMSRRRTMSFSSPPFCAFWLRPRSC